MPFHYPRQIRFHETDGAGVVYFANVLTLCHEAYEASLMEAGIDLVDFFSPQGIVVPVIHASVDFFKPMLCSDRVSIILTPRSLEKAGQPLSQFEIAHRLVVLDPAGNTTALIAQAKTRHCCIDAETRRRQQLPSKLLAWLIHWQTDS